MDISSTLMITGRTGSFGNAVLKYLKTDIKEIRIFSCDEKKQDDSFIKKCHNRGQIC